MKMTVEDRQKRKKSLREQATKKLLSIDEVSAALFVSRATVNRMIDDGQLPSICLRSGRRKKIIRVDDVDLQSFLENLKSDRSKKKNDHIRLATNR